MYEDYLIMLVLYCDPPNFNPDTLRNRINALTKPEIHLPVETDDSPFLNNEDWGNQSVINRANLSSLNWSTFHSKTCSASGGAT